MDNISDYRVELSEEKARINPSAAKLQPILGCESGRSLRKIPSQYPGHAFDDILCIVIASEAQPSFSHKQSVPPDKGCIGL